MFAGVSRTTDRSRTPSTASCSSRGKSPRTIGSTRARVNATKSSSGTDTCGGAAAAPPQVSVPELDLVAFTRARVEPMVRGLFPRDEQEAVLGVLERSVVLLTPANIADVLRNGYWLHTAWDLANLFLASVGADLLGPDATGIVGLSEETTCYI